MRAICESTIPHARSSHDGMLFTCTMGRVGEDVVEEIPTEKSEDAVYVEVTLLHASAR